MSDKEEARSDNFPHIFSASQNPSICLDSSYLDREEEGDYEYTVRKFSTTSSSKKRLVDEGEERRRSPSRDSVQQPIFYTAFLGSSSTGKTSLCNQFRSSTMLCWQEDKAGVSCQTELQIALTRPAQSHPA